MCWARVIATCADTVGMAKPFETKTEGSVCVSRALAGGCVPLFRAPARARAGHDEYRSSGTDAGGRASRGAARPGSEGASVWVVLPTDASRVSTAYKGSPDLYGPSIEHRSPVAA